ncbi:hypothetical protein PAPHI01_1637 [Pancytospora philotis]|nr:hypothetical protein PAPHI01_1637 [Pancytospora philotis]
MMWLPAFDTTFRLMVLSMLFDSGCTLVLYHYSIFTLVHAFVVLALLSLSKAPIYTISRSHFSRKLIGYGCAAGALSIVLVLATNLMLFWFDCFSLHHRCAVAVCALSPAVIFLESWLCANIVMLRRVLFEDVTLPSKMSILELQQHADELGERLCFL